MTTAVEIAKCVGQRLAHYRAVHGMRPDDIAEQLGISRAAVYRYEKGEMVKLDTLERVAALLGMSFLQAMAPLSAAEKRAMAATLVSPEKLEQLKALGVNIG